jgi:hypothetical protein
VDVLKLQEPVRPIAQVLQARRIGRKAALAIPEPAPPIAPPPDPPGTARLPQPIGQLLRPPQPIGRLLRPLRRAAVGHSRAPIEVARRRAVRAVAALQAEVPRRRREVRALHEVAVAAEAVGDGDELSSKTVWA